MRCTGVAGLIALLVLMAPGAVLGQDISVSVPARMEAAPGTVVSIPVRVAAGAAAGLLRIDPILPPGWSVLIPPPGIDAVMGAPTTRIVSIQIPSGARAGAWQVAFRIRVEAVGDRAESLAEAETRITVTELTSLAITLVNATARIRAGAAIVATFSIENTGNHAASFRILAESSLGYEIQGADATVELDPSARREIRVTARTRDDLVNELSHVLRLGAVRAGDVGGAADDLRVEARATTLIVPVRRRAQRLEEADCPLP